MGSQWKKPTHEKDMKTIERLSTKRGRGQNPPGEKGEMFMTRKFGKDETDHPSLSSRREGGRQVQKETRQVLVQRKWDHLTTLRTIDRKQGIKENSEGKT